MQPTNENFLSNRLTPQNKKYSETPKANIMDSPLSVSVNDAPFQTVKTPRGTSPSFLKRGQRMPPPILTNLAKSPAFESLSDGDQISPGFLTTPLSSLSCNDSPGSSCVSSPASFSASLKRRRPGFNLNLDLKLKGIINNPNQDDEVTPSPFTGITPTSGDSLESFSGFYRPSNSPGIPEHAGPVQVLDNLYIGSQASAEAIWDRLGDYNISGVINCANGKSAKVLTCPDGISEMSLRFRDKVSQDISMAFYPAIDFIEKTIGKGGSVLVFCWKGVSRSATIVLAYLIWKNMWSFEQALSFLRTKREKVCPNVGFCFQLTTWANTRPSLSGGQSIFYKIRLADEHSWITNASGKKVPLVYASGPVSQFTPGTQNTSIDLEANDLLLLDDQDTSPCWIVVSPSEDVQYIWYEAETPQEYLDAARLIANQICNLENGPIQLELVPQGQETDQFWRAVADAREEDSCL